MNLIYSIPDKLYYIQNFLDYSTYKKLHYDAFNESDKLKTTTDWGDYLLHGYKQKTEYSHIDSSYKPIFKLKTLIKSNPFHKINNDNFSFIIHSMNDGAGINWHSDDGHEYGITYYLNRRWNPKFGGEFLFMSDHSNGFIPLVGNSLVIVKAPLFHKVVSITKPLVPRKTIQIFIDKQ